ncbi:peptide-methionine (S)-S-oxide reductase MsrA [Pseudozobellia thermophila]|uniref:Peptide methionine sulfoxide reductase MsrA n=1 Tax=Pseudozobellia thermophila TaxID=192903 RepID=A0A1M6HZ87_9FLAO|nr:peptide-methionine (S)-S-oxide reductase MsrA [Pseudozobellia thermophila]SHJ27473.1 peptide-methionine (S)-S-oxide reductase [Pseudozobellia thermophila]
MHQTVLIILSLLLGTSCQSNTKNERAARNSPDKEEIVKPEEQELQKYETAYFASGCFWCVEAIFESVKGVKEVVSGYSGGTQKNPKYEQVAAGKTKHAETVQVYYDPSVISFTALVQVFFGSHDPTTLNRQGPDHGPQYRSIAFYKTEEEKKIIESYIKALEDHDVFNGRTITTQVTKFASFYKAEEYHQDFERKNPNNPYIKAVSIPRLNRFKENFKDYLKDDARH